MHKFCDEDVLDGWYENGKMISYNPVVALQTTFDVDDQGEIPVDNDELVQPTSILLIYV